MDDVHGCSKCDSILINSESTGKNQECFEMFLVDFLHYAIGPEPCEVFAMLYALCDFPDGYLSNAKESTRIALQYDKDIDSSLIFSIAVLPRRQDRMDRYYTTDAYTVSSTKCGGLIAFKCQMVTDQGLWS